jgi:CHASE3 domain sensor protein
MIYRQRKRHVLIGVLIALLVLVIIGIVSYSTIYRNQQEARWMANTYENLQNIKAFQANINGAETGNRSFIITGDSTYLKNFSSAKEQNNTVLNKLMALNKDDAAFQKQITTLQHLSEERFEKLDIVRQISENKGFKAAQDLINQGKGRQLMDSINAITSKIIADENASLIEQRNSSKRTAEKVYLTIVTGTIFSVVLIIVMFILLIAQIALTQKSEQDIRQAKEAEEILSEKLMLQNTQLQEFAYLISHNLKAPVNNLNALLDLYSSKTNKEECDLIINKVDSQSRKLKIILAQLLEALKIKQNTNKKREKISFEDVFSRVKELLSNEISEVHADIKADFSKAPTLTYPRPYLENIMLNLFSNALKHRYPDRNVQINFETEIIDNQLILRVSDNGLGIDMDKYGHRLFSLNKSPFQDNKQSGISLFVIKTQIEALGGEIKVESIENKGTIFVVTFNKA